MKEFFSSEKRQNTLIAIVLGSALLAFGKIDGAQYAAFVSFLVGVLNAAHAYVDASARKSESSTPLADALEPK